MSDKYPRNKPEITDGEFKNELATLLEQMNAKQIGQFLTVISARNIIYLSDYFFKHETVLRYLNALFISLGYNRVIFFNDLARNLARDLAPNLDSDLDLALDLALTRNLALDHSLTRNLVLDLALDLVHNLVREYKETTLSSARKILRGDLSKLHVHTKGYKYDFERFLNNLRKSNADYWAEWFNDLFENNFKLSEKHVDEIFFLEERHFELSIAATSELLLDMREKGAEFFNETRLILLGDKGTGKTSFARRFEKLDDDMPGEKESTPGVDFKPVRASGVIPAKYDGKKDFTMNIWDFAGHTVTHAAHKFFLSDSAVYVLVLRGRTEQGNTSINEWLEHMRYYTGELGSDKIKVYILVNKSDDHIPKTEYDPKYDNYFDIEIKPRVINLKEDNEPGGSLDIFRGDITDYAAGFIQKRKISKSILDIKKDIEETFKGLLNVGKTKIADTIKRHMPNSDADEILRVLHSYGICFYYDKLQGLQTENVVLNPRWITYAIYRLINFITNDQEKNLERNDGHIYESEYETAFTAQDIDDQLGYYPEKFQISGHNHKFVSMLAQTFELAYRNEKDELLIFPICLPENYPNKEPGLNGPGKDDFFVEITTDTERDMVSPITFPKDIIPAFIVKRHKDLDHLEYLGCEKQPYCSKNGAVLKRGSIKAEVKKKTNSKIVVLVKGSNEKSCEYGAELITGLYDVIQKYRIFQDDENRPAIKIWFTDKNNKDRSCDIEDILEDDSWIKAKTEPTVMDKLKKIAYKLNMYIKERIKLGVKDLAEVELEASLGKNKKDEEKKNKKEEED